MIRSQAVRAVALQEELEREGEVVRLPDDRALKLVRARDRCERTRPPPTVEEEVAATAKALMPLAQEALELFPDLGVASILDQSRVLFALREAAGDPWTWTPLLVQDVASYERMTGPLCEKALVWGGSAWPRRFVTRPGFVAAVLLLLAGCELWMSTGEETAGRRKVQLLAGAVVTVFISCLWYRCGPLGVKLPVKAIPDEQLTDPIVATTAMLPAVKEDEAATLKAEVARLQSAVAMAPSQRPTGAPAPPVANMPPEPVASPLPTGQFDGLRAVAADAQSAGPLFPTACTLGGGAADTAGPAPARAALAEATEASYAPLASSFQEQCRRQAREVQGYWDAVSMSPPGGPSWQASF